MNRRQAGSVLPASAAGALEQRSGEDLRAQTGLQDVVAAAPVDVIHVAHAERMAEVNDVERHLHLPEGRFVTFAQTVGHAADGATAGEA